MKEKKEITIYEDGTISGSEEEFGEVVVNALSDSRDFRALIAAAIDTYHFKSDPIGWFLRDPEKNKKILEEVAEKMRIK